MLILIYGIDNNTNLSLYPCMSRQQPIFKINKDILIKFIQIQIQFFSWRWLWLILSIL